MSDLLVVGELNADVIVRDPDPRPRFGQVERLVESVELALGSSSAIFACGTARLGVPTTFVGVVGDDPLGRFVVGELRARGVDVSHCIVDTAHPTGASVILSAGDDRAVMTSLGTIPLLDVARVPADLVRDARHVHVGSYYLLDAAREGLPGLFRAARAGGASTSLDTNWDPSGRWDGGIWTLLADTDLFFPNEEEARRLAGTDDAVAAARAIAKRAGGRLTVALKRGPRGALAIGPAGALEVAAPAIEAVDTTGAGDSFDAGFVAGHLGGLALGERLVLAVACGALSTLRIGGTAGQPSTDEARRAVADWGLTARPLSVA